MSKERSKRKISVQKIFNLVSLMFLLACVIFYGGRFIKLYIENNKVEETNSMAKNIKESNKDNKNFKSLTKEQCIKYMKFLRRASFNYNNKSNTSRFFLYEKKIFKWNNSRKRFKLIKL